MSRIKQILITLGVFLVLLLVIFLQYKSIKSQKEETERWRSNYTSINTELISVKDDLGRTQNEVESLQLTRKELTSSLYQKDSTIRTLTNELKLSNVKIKHLQWVLGASINSGNSGTTVIDTVHSVKYDTIEVPLIRKFTVDDSYLRFEGIINPDSLDWQYQYREQLVAWSEMYPTLYKDNGKERGKFWVWLFPKRSPKLFIKSTNPNSEIQATEIEIR